MKGGLPDIPTLLFYNLTVLMKLFAAPESLKKCVERGMFSRPNRRAFEEVVHYLICAYDPSLGHSSFTVWPIVERTKQERVFRREVMVAVEKITSREPDFGLPTFAASFATSPGGSRLENFFCRLSALALDRVLQRRGHHDLCDYPKGNNKRCLEIAKARLSAEANALCKEIQSFVGLATCCAENTRRLNIKLLQTNATLKTARSHLRDLELSENEGETFDAEMEKNLGDRLKKLQRAVMALEEHESRIGRCGEAASGILQDRLVPTTLDGGCEQPLDIADLLRNVLGVVGELSCSDFSSNYGEALPDLEAVTENVAAISRRVEKTLNGMTQLMDSVSNDIAAPEAMDGIPITSVRLRGACQLLEEASYRTPPLQLRPRCNGAFVSLSSDAESPPISNVTDLLCTKKPPGPVEAASISVEIQRPLASSVPRNIFKPTPMRPRSTIAGRRPQGNLPVGPTRPGNPVMGAVPKTKTTVSSRTIEVTPVQKESISKATKTPASNMKGTTVLQSPQKGVNTSSQESKTETISPVADKVPDGPVQEVLELAASLLSPSSGAKVGGNIFPELDRESSSTDLEPFKFTENMSVSPHKKEAAVEPEESQCKKPEARKSLLAVIDRYKMICAEFAPPETSPSESGALSPDMTDIDINLDEEYDSFVIPFELSLELEMNGL